jgi:hypothetical protein
VSDESQIQIRPSDGDSSLVLSSARSSLVARGRRDAEILAERAASVVICNRCGESKESDDADDECCRLCRSREREIAEIWHRWGFYDYGLPVSGVWDDDALGRDTQAKLEIDRRLEELGVRARWIEMRWGFATQPAYYAENRFMTQAYWSAISVNHQWGFDSDGNPIGKVWDDDAKRRAAFALKELKKILASLGLPLEDDWPDGWSPDEPWALNPGEISEGIRRPDGVVPWWKRTCHKCGEHKELVFAGSVCARCSDFLDSRWLQSEAATATDWILTAGGTAEPPARSYYVYRNTTYAQMKVHWATWANASDALHFVPALFPLDTVDGPSIRPATSKEIVDHKDYIDDDYALASQIREQYRKKS